MTRASFDRIGLALMALLAGCSGDDPSNSGDAEPAEVREAGAEPDAAQPSQDAQASADAAGRDATTSGDTDSAAPSIDAATQDAGTPTQDAGSDADSATRVDATGPGSWTRGMTMPTPRTELAVAELNGKIYVAGGHGGLSTFEAYAPASDSWEKRADLPVGREHPSLAALNGLVYLTGGRSAEVFAYDPAANTWSSKAPLIHDRWGAAAVALGGALYVIGGTGPNDTVIQRYDPAANAWTARARLSMRRDHVAAVALGSKIYVLGGRPGVGDVYKSVEIYDPTMDSLEPGPDMLEGRSGFGAANVNGNLCVAGGEILIQPFSVRDTAEMLNPSTGTWTFKAKLPMRLHGVGAVGFEGRMYMFGGASNPASATPRQGGVHILTP